MTSDTLHRERVTSLSSPALPRPGFTPVSTPSVRYLNENDPARHPVSAGSAPEPIERRGTTGTALLLAVVILLVIGVGLQQLMKPVSNDSNSPGISNVDNSDSTQQGTVKQDTGIDNASTKPTVKWEVAPVFVSTGNGDGVYCPAPGSPVVKFLRGSVWMPEECWAVLGLPVPSYQQR